MKYTTETFIQKAREKHSNKFSYDKSKYIDSRTKVVVTCPHHGDFEIEPASHLRGTGCRGCQYAAPSAKKYSVEEVMNKIHATHGDRYDYSKFEYKGAKTKSIIICKEHGEFEQTPQLHMMGSGCPECGKKNGRKRKTTSEFIHEAKEVHRSKYMYDKTIYKYALESVTITCPEHGDFEQIANQHIKGNGCPKCAITTKSEDRKLDYLYRVNTVMNILNNLGYKLEGSIPNNSNDKFEVSCVKHGTFMTSYHQLVYLENKCPKCAGTVSGIELKLANSITEKGISIIQNDRTVLEGKEIDILIPEFNIGIEVNGIIWHSTKYGKGPDYHIGKTIKAKEGGIELLHFFEDEMRKEDIVSSMVLNKCGMSKIIHARKCNIVELSNKEAREFCELNHIKGPINSSINLGLKFNGEIVSVMTFSNLRKILGSSKEEGAYELLRFCNKVFTSVVGGASKLLSYFEKTYKPKKLISYSDKRYSTGDLYRSIGFEYVSTSSPNYFYVKSGSKRLHRYLFTKDSLVRNGEDPNLSESKIMENNGYYRIYDCGADKFQKQYNL